MIFGKPKCFCLDVIENPKKAHELSIHKEHMDKVCYFPITTGSSEFASVGMTDKDRSAIRDSVHWTGVSSIHNIGHLSFQPYDPKLKLSTNALFGNHGYAIVASDQPLDAVMSSINAFDPRNLSVDEYLKYTQHLEDNAVVKAPVSSAPVELIFKTFPQVLETLRSEGIERLDLFEVMKTDDESPHFIQFPVGSLRIAKKVVGETPITSKQKHFGLPKINV